MTRESSAWPYTHLTTITNPPLRRRSMCGVLCAILLTVLFFSAFVHFSFIAHMPSDVASVFLNALVMRSSGTSSSVSWMALSTFSESLMSI